MDSVAETESEVPTDVEDRTTLHRHLQLVRGRRLVNGIGRSITTTIDGFEVAR